MASGRLSDRARASAAIWPGFVDAMTALLLVLMFVLSIFMLVQFVLRTQISGQETLIEVQEDQISSLNEQLSSLSNVLAMEVTRADDLEGDLTVARATLVEREGRIDELSGAVDALEAERRGLNTRIASFESQVASLIAARAKLQSDVNALEAAQAAEADAKDALSLALASARAEIDAQAEEARRAAAEREALDALVATLRSDKARGEGALSLLQQKQAETLALLTALEDERDAGLERISKLTQELSDEEKSRLAALAAADTLRERLRDADSELTAMTLALEERRREAEETLTLLAAAQAARDGLAAEKAALEDTLDEALSESEKRAALLAIARSSLQDNEAVNAEQAKALALLNEQSVELRAQLAQLSAQLDASEAKDKTDEAQISALGSRLNAALAREVQLKAREAERLRKEKESLTGYRSEFFGEMKKALGERPEIRIVGDRFIFQSEVLFPAGSAQLGEPGRAELSNLATALRDVISSIPARIDWLLVAEGHTDNVPLGGGGRYRDNWELSQARALSVVRFLNQSEGIPPDRLAALGYGEYQPIDPADTPEARARNRRIELKFTERPARGDDAGPAGEVE